uniref:hypothetical protein n=1 Tax=Actinosynnema sp. TaxID=1872144 RepID=UPI003F83EEB2
TQARAAEMAARRLDLADRFLEEAEELLDRLHGPYTVFSFGGKENIYSEHIVAMPPSSDVRNLMQSAALAFDKHLAAVKHDTHDGTDVGTSLVGQLADGLQRAYDAMVAQEHTEVVVDDPDRPERGPDPGLPADQP